MKSTRQSWFEGWRLFAVLTLTLIALCVWIAGMRQFEVEGIRMVIRFTARSSMMLFCLAFGAAALARLRPNAWTRWQRRNRCYLGVAALRMVAMAPRTERAAGSIVASAHQQMNMIA